MELSDNTVVLVLCGRARRDRRPGRLALLGAVLASSVWGGAEAARADLANPAPSTDVVESSPPPNSAPGLGATPIDLDRLLRLPSSYQQPTANRAGAGKEVWRGRFELVRADLHEAEDALATAQEELGKAASETGSYSVAAPGTTPNPENTPLSYKLRQEIRRQRERVEDAEHHMRELEVEADLASVPSDWRAPLPDAASTN